MESKLAEKAREQRYFDHAAVHRSRHIEELQRAHEAAVHPAAAAKIKKEIEAYQQKAHEAVAFGRIDTEDDERLYIGHELIRDDQSNVLVISWKAPAAAPYYQASHANPHGVRRKRTYECEGNTILDFTDVLFGVEPETADEFLHRALGRPRSGKLREIVATIQAAQYDIVSKPHDRVLVVEGGPGTGKTVIALHRVSWLLYHHPELHDGGVLVVGPHPTFIRYISDVLPSLGDPDVELRHITQLAPPVRRGRSEPDDVTRLKGDARMAAVLTSALESRITEPQPLERIPIEGRFVSIPGAEIAAVVAECRAMPLPYKERREVFRERLEAMVSDRGVRQVSRASAITNLVERIWPQQSPTAFLHNLYGSRQRLAAAAAGLLSEEETLLLYRRGADRLSEEVWSDADLPLLDELDHLINGTDRRYAHLVVDEAQDLSPMQLRSLARRSATGSMTVVGDIAQSTGPWARDSWDEVIEHLPRTVPAEIATLRYGYRVPRQPYEYAAALLRVAAPHATPPEVVREGPRDATVHQVRVEERPGRVVAVALEHARSDRFVGIVCPDRCRREVEAALAANGVEWSSAERGELGAAINLVSPRESKGLEFDAVVVVEPEYIVAEHHRGHRMLYVALTRTTGYLDVVCVGHPLPLVAPTPPPMVEHKLRPSLDVEQLAAHIAGQLRNAAPSDMWGAVLDRVRNMLSGSQRDGASEP